MNKGRTKDKVAVIGELNVDLVITGLTALPKFGQEILATDFQLTLGSASAIFACGVAKLGYPVTFISKVGDDDFGRHCLEALRQAGVPTKGVRKDSAVKTGVTFSLSAQHDRALVTYPGAIAQLDYAELPLSALKGHRHLHLTSYFLQQRLQPFFPQIFAQARQMKLTTSFDPNSDPSLVWKGEIQEALAHTDVLFLNEMEALKLTRRRDVRSALECLGPSVPCVVIKRGRRGAMAMKDRQIFSASGFEVEALDSTGAGDSFDAGFIAGFLEGRTVRECLELANACGALSTLQAGGTAGQPDRARLGKFLRANAARKRLSR